MLQRISTVFDSHSAAYNYRSQPLEGPRFPIWQSWTFPSRETGSNMVVSRKNNQNLKPRTTTRLAAKKDGIKGYRKNPFPKQVWTSDISISNKQVLILLDHCLINNLYAMRYSKFPWQYILNSWRLISFHQMVTSENLGRNPKGSCIKAVGNSASRVNSPHILVVSKRFWPKHCPGW